MLKKLESWMRLEQRVRVFVLAKSQEYAGIIQQVDETGFVLKTKVGTICFPHSAVIVLGE